MTLALDAPAVARAAAGLVLRLPRVAHRGRLGEVRAASIGSAMELHDFREYQPGDDVRHLDWNAVARTGQLVLRVRHDEVSPRVEVLVDGSRSMAASAEKAARAREVALWLCTLAAQGGLEPTLLLLDAAPRRGGSAQARRLLESAPFEGRAGLQEALRQAPPLRTCGVRLVVSDWLFEAEPGALAAQLARGAAALALVQLADPEDLVPTCSGGLRLVDLETGEAVERFVTAAVLGEYRSRLAAHLEGWRAAARRVQASFLPATADEPLERLARGPLAPLVEAGR